jgi:hypothetical protein
MLDLERIRRATLVREPFDWAAIHGVIDTSDIRALDECAPTGEVAEVAGASDEKPYRMFVRPLVRLGKRRVDRPEMLAPAWIQLCAEFLDTKYSHALSDFVGIDLSGCATEVSFWVYDRNCFLAPHTDKPDKVLTHLFYLTPRWSSLWKGALRLLRSADSNDCTVRLFPEPLRSIVLIRSASSWHSVEAVDDQAEETRRSIQVCFWKH